MKLWKRMALWSLLLFIVIFNISGLAIIESSHASELHGELGRVLEQQQTLSSGIGVLLQNGIAETEGLELQILRNYVASYARNAMPPGSYLEVLRQDRKASPKKGNITLGIFRHGVQSGIFVKDEGSGIPPEALTRLFEPFYTTDEARAGQNGVGLGLAICFQIAELHDWKIEVESETANGIEKAAHSTVSIQQAEAVEKAEAAFRQYFNIQSIDQNLIQRAALIEDNGVRWKNPYWKLSWWVGKDVNNPIYSAQIDAQSGEVVQLRYRPHRNHKVITRQDVLSYQETALAFIDKYDLVKEVPVNLFEAFSSYMEGIGVEFRYGPDQFIMLYFNEAGAVRSIVIRDLEICLEERVVRKKGEEVYLTHKEFELLALFIQNQSIALSREQILEHVWGYDYMGETRTVDMHVQRLRSKLGLQDAIVTVYKTGYRFDIPNQKKTSR